MRRFLHHVAELAPEAQRALAGPQRHLDGQDLAAAVGPGEARGGAELVALLLPRRPETRHAEVLLEVVLADRGLVIAPLEDDLAGDLAEDRGDLALHVPDAGLARVLADDLAEGAF